MLLLRMVLVPMLPRPCRYDLQSPVEYAGPKTHPTRSLQAPPLSAGQLLCLTCG